MKGTRAFQSINILRSYKKKNKFTPHSYMDDLESFFYVLCWVCCGYSAPGRGSKIFRLPSLIGNITRRNKEQMSRPFYRSTLPRASRTVGHGLLRRRVPRSRGLAT